ncbi:MAG: cyclase family protein [Actinomycetota bacterium]|nr:cyclase family protein [Actinomycetota bacterium]
MRFDHARRHLELLSRRDALKLGAAGAATAAIGGLTLPSAGASARRGGDEHAEGEGGDVSFDEMFDDAIFDIEAVVAGAWAPGPYGAEDQRGTFNEVTAERTAAALAMLDTGQPVHTFQLGELVFNGFPAYPSDPPRVHEQHLYSTGHPDLPDGFADAGGIVSSTEPVGPNLVTGFEERYSEYYTLQIATQIDGLGHVGVGGTYYNGHTAADLATPTGLALLGNEHMGPIVTRGVVLDIVGLKVSAGASDDVFEAPNGRPVLRDNYRITIDDINHCLYRQRIEQPIGAGDVVIFHTGWTHLVSDDPERYLTQEPGPYLAEARYLASKKVAMIGSDVWGLEVLDPEVTGGYLFPVHQELFGKHGIRIGEGFVTDAAIDAGVYDGVFLATPQNVAGATAGNAPPALLGQPGPGARD